MKFILAPLICVYSSFNSKSTNKTFWTYLKSFFSKRHLYKPQFIAYTVTLHPLTQHFFFSPGKRADCCHFWLRQFFCWLLRTIQTLGAVRATLNSSSASPKLFYENSCMITFFKNVIVFCEFQDQLSESMQIEGLLFNLSKVLKTSSRFRGVPEDIIL